MGGAAFLLFPLATMNRTYAILLDGGFVTRKLRERLEKFPTAAEVVEFCFQEIIRHVALNSFSLLRIYFYDSPPSQDKLTNPISRAPLELSQTDRFKEMTTLLNDLELQDNFALRTGETAVHGWKLGRAALKNIGGQTRPLTGADLVPNIEQKGVDLRIGLDIARLALREMVGTLVVVTGDSDFIPAFKFSRREGVRVYLHHMGHSISRELKVHTDLILG